MALDLPALSVGAAGEPLQGSTGGLGLDSYPGCRRAVRTDGGHGEGRSKVNQYIAQIHNCETARDMRETAVSRWGVSRETARDSARQRETARDSARQPRDSRESDVNPCSRLVNLRPDG
jgi:hypothetical protein